MATVRSCVCQTWRWVSTKPATLETGLVIQVPGYLEADELVLVDTREARFAGRAKG